MKVCAIVPIKLKSERLKNKNFLLLNKKPLLVNIFRTLTMVKEIDNIYCYSSDLLTKIKNSLTQNGISV